jgi:DNA-binding MarR family transcriptional regulator
MGNSIMSNIIDLEQPKPVLRSRELRVLKMVGDGQNMGDLSKLMARSPHQVRKIVKVLVEAGYLGRRFEPRWDRGVRDWFVWRIA